MQTNGTSHTASRPGEIRLDRVIVAYGENVVVKEITLGFKPGTVTAIIGPSGCGKTTLLRSLNRLTDITAGCTVQGDIRLDGEDILRQDPVLLRRRVGMVFQKPNPFPMSIKDNVIYGVKAHNKRKSGYKKIVETSLERAAVWDEVKERLNDSALTLSVGQQQRLCIARALAVEPEVLLMDEPAAALDPISTARLEESIIAMKGRLTVIMVTHDVQEAARVSDYLVFMHDGRVVETGETAQMFEAPEQDLTREYISGRLPVGPQQPAAV